MKKLFLIILPLLCIVLFSCKKDEDNDDRDEWVGSYEISYDCTGTGNYNYGEETDYSYIFIISKRDVGGDMYDDQIEFDNMESLQYARISGSDFVDLQGRFSGYLQGNRIVFTQFEAGGAGFSRDCGEPITAYKR